MSEIYSKNENAIQKIAAARAALVDWHMTILILITIQSVALEQLVNPDNAAK